MPNYRHGPGIDLQMGLRYYQRVLKTARPNLIAYLTLGETVGLTAFDATMNGCNGAHNPAGGAVSIAQPGIGDEKTSTLFSATGYCNIAGAALTALNSRFNGQELTVSSWQKSNILLTAGRPLYVIVDAPNRFYLERLANNTVQAVYIAGGTVKAIIFNPASVQVFIHMAFTASLSNNQMKLYINGVQQGATLNGLGTWAGNLTDATIGAINNTAGIPYIGWIQHVAIWNTALTPGQIADLARYG